MIPDTLYIIMPCYNEEEVLPETSSRLKDKLSRLIDAGLAGQNSKILFVDDDQIQLNLLSELMKKEGLPCVCCLNAEDALDHLRKTSFDIIFTDIQIPGVEGFELVKRIRASNFPKAAVIPIIAFSAGCQKSESELLESGFTEFLLKPFKARQLLEIVEKTKITAPFIIVAINA